MRRGHRVVREGARRQGKHKGVWEGEELGGDRTGLCGRGLGTFGQDIEVEIEYILFKT
ncbi:hypothetical protein HOLleu_01919 [Holothuria leucospilota]|uniref:Uncharacterized protein n=1 Tax=Holothuria leucospilota TaxID=206669 RepID=A0A9Q1H244_HOLLE|nr:hypothetical protein HOLleu_25879 [Holothuria leucospilota]KAJ8049250.1 hypothetical protein HOLleu_01919 [Holothuria leucospilota]